MATALLGQSHEPLRSILLAGNAEVTYWGSDVVPFQYTRRLVVHRTTSDRQSPLPETAVGAIVFALSSFFI